MIDGIYWENNTECKYCYKPEEKVNIIRKLLIKFGIIKYEEPKCICNHLNKEIKNCNNDNCPILHPEFLK